MNHDLPLRRLLDQLQAADAVRQGIPRDTPAYVEAADRVDELVRAVWEAADDDPGRGAVHEAATVPDEVMKL